MDLAQIRDGYKNRITLFIYWGLLALTLLAAGIFLWLGEWTSSVATLFILGLMLVPSILKERYRIYIPFALEFGIVVFIFLTLFLGWVAEFYTSVPFWDKFLHFQSGFLLGASGYVLVYVLNEHKRFHLNLSPGFVSFFAITFSLAIGALWEIFEFAADIASQSTYWQDSNTDTMLDLIADGAGAIIVAIIGYFWMHRHKRLPLTPWLFQMLRRKKRELPNDANTFN